MAAPVQHLVGNHELYNFSRRECPEPSESGAKKTHNGMAHKGIILGSRIVEKTGRNPSEISRGRWPCGRKPPVKRRTPFPENIPLCLCVFVLGPPYLGRKTKQTSIVGFGLQTFQRHGTCKMENYLNQPLEIFIYVGVFSGP